MAVAEVERVRRKRADEAGAVVSGLTPLFLAYDCCPLCGGRSVERGEPVKAKFHDHMIQWVDCQKCGHNHARDYWTDEGLTKVLGLMRQEQMFGGELDNQRSAWDMVIHRIMPILDTVRPSGFEPGRWLDVGTGNGAFVFTAAEFGYDAVGLDLRPHSVEALTRLGYKAELADAMTYDYSGAEVVVLADILEHVAFPRKLLNRIRDGLRGVLFVSCPNMDCVSWRYTDLKNKNPYWSEAEHLHNFSRVSLTKLLRSCGFRVRDFSVSRRYAACMEIIAT